MSTRSAAADRNLLFGILAVQMNFISRDALIQAMNAWVLRKEQSLGQILLEQKALAKDTHQLLDALVAKHLALHDNDAAQSLAAVSSVGSLREDLGQVTDADVQVSLAAVNVSAAADLMTRAPSLTPGDGSGLRFRVLRPHARGGLGEVFVAHDHELGREVALKEIQVRHADNHQSRARFLLEAEITGGLEHPGIVPVYGLGQYADGRPYYAMRFIQGDSLKDALERFHRPGTAVDAVQHNLQLRALLGRFIDVCNAMAYAHGRGVLHRDLKPGNIMLGKYGETLVVDWGLAKAVDVHEDHRDETVPPLNCPSSAQGTVETQAGAALGTPQFMSPEQAAGRLDQLGPVSDVYSLGASLYSVLTGKLPFPQADVGAVLRKVQAGEFAAPRQVKPDVPRPLEAICLKAMAVRPDDRYRSARDLADDLEHWLADEPVSVWRESMAERAGRWVRRHRTGVLSIAAGLLVGLVSLLTAVVLLAAANERERQARNEAVRNFQEAEKQRALAQANFETARRAVDQYFTRVSEATLLNQPGMQGLRRTLLEDALAYYRQFLKERQDDPGLRDQYADTRFREGRILEEIDGPAAAVPTYEDALELQRQLSAAAPADRARQAALGHTLNALGRVRHKLQQPETALQSYRDAAGLRQELLKVEPGNAEYRRTLANSLMNIGLILQDRKDAAGARKHLEEAQAQRRQLIEQNQGGIAVRRDQGMGNYNLGVLALRAGDQAAALARLQDARADFETVAAADAHDLNIQYQLAVCCRLVADLLAATQQPEQAREFYGRARTVLHTLSIRNPDVPDYRSALAGLLMNLAQFETTHRQLAAADPLFAQAIELLTKMEQPQAQRDRAVAQRALALLRLKAGNKDQARDLLSQSQVNLGKLVKQFPDNVDFRKQQQETALVLEKMDKMP